MKLEKIEDGYAVVAMPTNGLETAIAEVALDEEEDVLVYFPEENLAFGSMGELEEFLDLIRVAAQAILSEEEVDPEYLS